MIQKSKKNQKIKQIKIGDRYDEESNSYWFEINGKTFSEIKRATGATKIFNGLTGFETRELAQGKNKNAILNRIEEPSFVPESGKTYLVVYKSVMTDADVTILDLVGGLAF